MEDIRWIQRNVDAYYPLLGKFKEKMDEIKAQQ